MPAPIAGRHNPAKARSDDSDEAAKPIPAAAQARFADARDSLMTQLSTGTFVETQEAL